MKKCCICGNTKPLSEFNKHKNRKDGRQTACKLCNKQYTINHYYKNQKEIANQRKEKYPKIREKRLQSGKNYYENNKSQALARYAKRRAAKLQRTPNWLSKQHIQDIKILYERAYKIKIFTGEIWHVDHIIPLQGRDVSGLHVPWNLQLLPAKENLSKSNQNPPQ